METDILFMIIRESVSLGILVVVLIGGYRLLNKTIDLVDSHLGHIENDIGEIVSILKEYTNANH